MKLRRVDCKENCAVAQLIIALTAEAQAVLPCIKLVVRLRSIAKVHIPAYSNPSATMKCATFLGLLVLGECVERQCLPVSQLSYYERL